MGDHIKTTYRGHIITYGENSDEWWCRDLGSNYTNTSLAKVKSRIDKMYLDLRKKAATPCFEISDYGSGSKTDSSIIEYVGEKFESSWSTGSRQSAGHAVAVVARRMGSEKASRRETKLDGLMPDTPEAHAAWDRYAELNAAAEVARKAAADAFKSIPRMTPEDIAELIKIRETEERETDAP